MGLGEQGPKRRGLGCFWSQKVALRRGHLSKAGKDPIRAAAKP